MTRYKSDDMLCCYSCGAVKADHTQPDACPRPTRRHRPVAQGFRYCPAVKPDAVRTRGKRAERRGYRISLSFRADELLALEQLLSIVRRGGDASIVARADLLQPVYAILQSAKRRGEIGMSLAERSGPAPAHTMRTRASSGQFVSAARGSATLTLVEAPSEQEAV